MGIGELLVIKKIMYLMMLKISILLMVMEEDVEKWMYLEKKLQYMNQIKRNIYYYLLDVMNILKSWY